LFSEIVADAAYGKIGAFSGEGAEIGDKQARRAVVGD